MSVSIPALISEYQNDILKSWDAEQKANIRNDLIRANELQAQMKEFIGLFSESISSKDYKNLNSDSWKKTKDFLASISRSRGAQGFTPSETAMFVFALKKSLMSKLRETFAQSATSSDEIWEMGDILDKLGLYTTEIHQKSREEVINRQQHDMLELSTPVVEIAKGIIALPMIGTLDSSRTQVVMETLLHRIVETEAEIAIIDITGVPTVDTLVAQHLLKTVTAAKLMGADCIISGIRPQIAATIVHLGVELGSVVTKASLASAITMAMKRTGYNLIKVNPSKV